MANKKYSHGKKEMSSAEFDEMKTRPYRDVKGRRLSSEELSYFRPPGGGVTYVGEGSSEYGGKDAGGGRGSVAGPTSSQLQSIGLDKTQYTSPQEKSKINEILEQAEADRNNQRKQAAGLKKGGSVSASKRADGIAQRGKTRGKMI